MSAENGYVYTGDVSSYHVTMLRREPRKGTALVLIERCLTGEGTIPNGSEVTVPLVRVTPSNPCEKCERPSCRPPEYAPLCARHYLQSVNQAAEDAELHTKQRLGMV